MSPIWSVPWTPWGVAAGVMGLAVSGTAIWVIVRFLRANLAATKQNYAAPDQLLTYGLYARTQHPGVVANFLFVFGIAVAAGAVVTLALLPLFAMVLHLTCVIEERRVLQPHFKDTYATYAQTVPRYQSWPVAGGLSPLVVRRSTLDHSVAVPAVPSRVETKTTSDLPSPMPALSKAAAS